MTDQERKDRRKATARKYYEANREKRIESATKWRAANPEKAQENARQYYETTREKQIAVTAKWRAANPEKLAEQRRRYREANAEKVAGQAREYHAVNREKILEQKRKWKAENQELVKAQKRRRHAKKQKEAHPIYTMTNRVRTRMQQALRKNGFNKESTTAKMLGCSWKRFCQHIESQFADGMSWDNRSEWHLDHVLPLACATTIEGLEKLSHYTNIRPLWAAENLRKSDNLVLIP
jgi:hypothetical protein